MPSKNTSDALSHLALLYEGFALACDEMLKQASSNELVAVRLARSREIYRAFLGVDFTERAYLLGQSSSQSIERVDSESNPIG